MTTAVAAPRVHQATARVRERPAALPALTGLRFFAALLVVLYHFCSFRGGAIPQATWGLPGRLLANLVDSGPVAVNFFFVLSGFILAYSGLDAAGRLRGGVRAFWVRRFARLYPAYLLALALALPLLLWGAHPAGLTLLATLLTSLTLVQTWLPGHPLLAWNGVGWSLSVEALFYLCFPLLVPLLARLGRGGLKGALLVLWAALALPPVLYLVVSPDGLHSFDTLPAGSWLMALRVLPLLRLPEFLIGAVACRLWLLERARAAGQWPPQSRRPASALLPGLVLVGLLAALPLLPVSGFALTLLLREGALAPLCALLLVRLAGAAGPAPRRVPVVRVLGCPALVVLGEASYGLYLLHWPLWLWLARLLGVRPWMPAAADPLALPLFAGYMALALALSLLVLRLVERPGRRVLVQALAPRPALAVTPQIVQHGGL